MNIKEAINAYVMVKKIFKNTEIIADMIKHTNKIYCKKRVKPLSFFMTIPPFH